MRNLPIHAKTTQAQSPVILMTLLMTLQHTSKSHLKWCLYRRKKSNKYNWVWGNQWEETIFKSKGGGGVSLNIIVLWGRVEINFCFMRGGVWLSFGAYFTHFPAPLQVIIAQSLTPTHLLCHKQANSFWAEFLRSIFRFRKSKEI